MTLLKTYHLAQQRLSKAYMDLLTHQKNIVIELGHSPHPVYSIIQLWLAYVSLSVPFCCLLPDKTHICYLK